MGGNAQWSETMTGIAPFTRATARKLRRAMTPQEQRLWHHLRDLNHRLGTNFRRQAPVGAFIAGFADLRRRLVIEVDGGQHRGERDVRRDQWFKEQGFTVLRFWNNEVEDNIEGVMQTVLDALEAAPPPHTSPTRGEGGARRPALARRGRLSTSPPPCGEGMGVGGSPVEGRTP